MRQVSRGGYVKSVGGAERANARDADRPLRCDDELVEARSPPDALHRLDAGHLREEGCGRILAADSVTVGDD